MDKEAKVALIEDMAQQQGLTVREWRDDPDDGVQGVLGKFRVTEEDESRGLYDGDEGTLHATVVGSEEHHNVRVAAIWVAEGNDSGDEVTDLLALEEL